MRIYYYMRIFRECKKKMKNSSASFILSG
jgi:hypothetical protein